MKVISKYPVIVKGAKANQHVINDNYEGGYDNADGDTSTTSSKPKSIWDNLAAIENSGVVQGGLDIANKIKTNKSQGTTNTSTANAPTPTGAGNPDTKAGKDKPASKGMSSGAKVGIALGVIGVAVALFLVIHHKKEAGK